LPKPASLNLFSILNPHLGIVLAGLTKTAFPKAKLAIAGLKI